jgi:DNA-binding Lrp family transcriptional regulator
VTAVRRRQSATAATTRRSRPLSRFGDNILGFAPAIREVDEVLECHLVSGGYDYLLRFLTRGVNHYQEVIEELLERNIGIAKYFSYIVIKSPFIKTHCPIEKLFPHQR